MTEGEFRKLRGGLYPLFAEMETSLTALLFAVRQAQAIQDVRSSPAFSRAMAALHAARAWAVQAGEGELARQLAAALGHSGGGGDVVGS